MEDLKFEDYRKLVARLNGANLILENGKGEILLGKSAFPNKEGNYLFMLPGGGIERGEYPRHAVCMETTEETSIVVNEEDVELVGFFLQRVPKVTESNGTLFLYRAKIFEGTPRPSSELTEYRYFSHKEIIDLVKTEDQKLIGLGYLRLLCHYIRWLQQKVRTPIEARLSDKVAISSIVESPIVEI